ncbi:MAG: LysR family transcriptional regulator [Lachnospiraceae bacterium]|nr:LysR family transcriptional regulator [Lachnospiraceae bacterium]
MNSRQLQYAIALAEVRNFSQLADKLNMTQPALSKQILSLEKDLDIQLFDRTTTPLTLTPAGEFFIQQAQELLYKETQLIHAMGRFRSGEEGRLVVGISPFRCTYLIPDIVKKVRDRFPGVQVVLHEAGSDTLRKEAAEGKFDFAIVNLPVDDSILEITPIEQDSLVLAVPKTLNSALTEQPNNELDFSTCQSLPFVVVGQNQEMRQLFDKLCASADFIPRIVAEVVGLNTAWSLAHAGVGATLLPLQFVSHANFDKNLVLYKLKDTVSVRQPVIVQRRGQYLSDYAKYAIELLTQSK